MTKKQGEIVATYILFDDGDISTERLMAMVCDTCHCDISDVIDALEAAKRG